MEQSNLPPEDDQKQIVKNPILNFILMENFRSFSSVFKRKPVLVTLTILLVTIMITAEGSWGEIFDLMKTWIVIGVILAIWVAMMLGLSKIVGPKAAGVIGAILFLAVPVGFVVYVVMCWGGGC